MRTGSKAELAYLMMFFRVLMLRQHEAFVSEDEEDCLGGDDVNSGSDSGSDCEIDGEAGTANDGRDEDADDAADEEQWRQEGPWVGYSVRRFFQGVVVDGKTIGWLEADEEQGDGMCHADQTTMKTPTPSHRHPWPMIHAVDALWRIEHHDGDKEDLEEDELFIALYAHEHQSEVEPELEDAQEWAFERREGVEEGGEAEGEEGEEGEEGDNEGDGEGDEEGGGDDSTIRDALDKFVPFILKCRQESASSAQLQQLTRDGKLMMRDLKQAFGASRPGELYASFLRGSATHRRARTCARKGPLLCVHLSPCSLARSQPNRFGTSCATSRTTGDGSALSSSSKTKNTASASTRRPTPPLTRPTQGRPTSWTRWQTTSSTTWRCAPSCDRRRSSSNCSAGWCSTGAPATQSG